MPSSRSRSAPGCRTSATRSAIATSSGSRAPLFLRKAIEAARPRPFAFSLHGNFLWREASERATFVYADPGRDSDTELARWGGRTYAAVVRTPGPRRPRGRCRRRPDSLGSFPRKTLAGTSLRTSARSLLFRGRGALAKTGHGAPDQGPGAPRSRGWLHGRGASPWCTEAEAATGSPASHRRLLNPCCEPGCRRRIWTLTRGGRWGGWEGFLTTQHGQRPRVAFLGGLVLRKRQQAIPRPTVEIAVARCAPSGRTGPVLWVGSDPPLSGAGPPQRPSQSVGACCGSRSGRSLPTYPSGKGVAVPDRAVAVLYALAALFVLLGSGRYLGRLAWRTLRRIASSVTWRGAIAIATGGVATIAAARIRPWPEQGANAILDLVAGADPAAYAVLHAWSLAVPALAGVMSVLGLSGAWRLWIAEPSRARRSRGLLPPWPEEDPDQPRLVIGELHHPTEAIEIERPSWLVLDERGLYTGMFIVGAIGTGKTSACMHPFARQLFGWQANDPAKARGRTRARSQGRLLPPHPETAQGRRAGGGLSGDRAGRALAVEPPRHRHGFLLPRLQHGRAPQPTLRDWKGTVLATGIDEPRPLDHRASPRATWPLGDASGRLSLCH